MQSGYFILWTHQPFEVINLTERVRGLVQRTRNPGYVYVRSMHTTAALIENEDERGLHADLEDFLARAAPVSEHPGLKRSEIKPYERKGELLVPAYYQHDDLSVRTQNLREVERANGWSHLRAMMFPSQLWVPYEAGRLVLGEFQQILFLEFDGPQERRVYYRVEPCCTARKK